MKSRPLIFVLWAAHLQEWIAALFVTELRRLGLPVRVVGLHYQPVPGAFGLALSPDIGLEDALPLASQVSCLIVPGSWSQLHSLQQEPRLWLLIKEVVNGGGQLIAGAVRDLPSRHAHEFPVPSGVLVYPEDEALHPFVRRLALNLSTGLPSLPEFLDSPSATPSIVPHTLLAPEPPEDLVIRVELGATAVGLARALASEIQERGHAEIQATGAKAVSQMVKAAILAQQYFASEGYRLSFFPAFVQTPRDQIAIRFQCRIR